MDAEVDLVDRVCRSVEAWEYRPSTRALQISNSFCHSVSEINSEQGGDVQEIFV